MNIIVFDIETQNSFREVNNDFSKLKISVISIYEYSKDKYTSFDYSELNLLWPILENADLIIGYNSEHFDIPIMNNYYMGDLAVIPHLDLLVKIKDSLGIRLKLDDVAKATLDVSKSADGLQAIKWWQEGKIDEIKKYCEQDVKVTKEVYDFGLKHGQLFYQTFDGSTTPFAVDFNFKNTKEENASTPGGTINYTLPI